MKNIKIQISSPEHSEFVQKKLFTMGIGWAFGGQKVEHTDRPYLFVSKDNHLCIKLSSRDFSNGLPEHEDVTTRPGWCWPRPVVAGVDLAKAIETREGDKVHEEELTPLGDKPPFEAGKLYNTKGGFKVMCAGLDAFKQEAERPYVFVTNGEESFLLNAEGKGVLNDNYHIVGECLDAKSFLMAYHPLDKKPFVVSEDTREEYENRGCQVKEVIFNG